MSGSFNATADSSRVGLRFIKETTPGTTPATPTMVELEITSESLSNTRNTITSNSFRGDRQVPGATKVSESNGGELGFELKFSPAFDELFAGALQGTWSGNSLVNGVARASYTIEKEFGGISGNRFEVYEGAEISSVSLNIENGALVTGNFTVAARGYDENTTTIASVVTPAATTPFMNAVTAGFEVRVNGNLVEGLLQSAQITLDNNLREQRAIGSARLAGMGAGRSNLTGTLRAFFKDTSPLDTAYLAETPVAITLRVPDVLGNAYEIRLRSAVLTSRSRVAGGLDQDVVAEFGFQGVLGGNDSKTIEIIRDPA